MMVGLDGLEEEQKRYVFDSGTRLWLMSDGAGHGHCMSTSESLYGEEVVIVSSPQPSKPSDLPLNSTPSPPVYFFLSMSPTPSPSIAVNLSASYHG